MSNEVIAIASPAALESPAKPSEVRIWVDQDDDAKRVSAVLEALGYTVLRELEEGDGPARLRWAVSRLTRRHKLTAREQDILERVLAGRNNQEIAADLEIRRATVKWHMHNIFAKTNTNHRESLLRLGLQLGGVREAVASSPAKSGPSPDDAPIVDEADRTSEPDTAAEDEVIPATAAASEPWF